MINLSLKKIITWAILILGIYYLLSVVPKNKLEERDVLIITLVLFIAYVIFENFILHKFAENLEPALPPVPVPAPVPAPAPAPVPAPVPAPAPVPEPAPLPEPMIVEEKPAAPKIEECNSCKIDIKDNSDVKKSENDQGYQNHTYSAVRKYPSVGSRMEDGILPSEMKYTDYNSLPIGADINTKVDDFSYTFLPPDKWYPVPPHPPVCIAEKQCPVCPVTTTGTTANLKEWSEASRVTPGDQVNTTYLNEKLNSGR